MMKIIKIIFFSVFMICFTNFGFGQQVKYPYRINKGDSLTVKSDTTVFWIMTDKQIRKAVGMGDSLRIFQKQDSLLRQEIVLHERKAFERENQVKTMNERVLDLQKKFDNCQIDLKKLYDEADKATKKYNQCKKWRTFSVVSSLIGGFLIGHYLIK